MRADIFKSVLQHVQLLVHFLPHRGSSLKGHWVNEVPAMEKGIPKEQPFFLLPSLPVGWSWRVESTEEPCILVHHRGTAGLLSSHHEPHMSCADQTPGSYSPLSRCLSLSRVVSCKYSSSIPCCWERLIKMLSNRKQEVGSLLSSPQAPGQVLGSLFKWCKFHVALCSAANTSSSANTLRSRDSFIATASL